MDYPLRFIGLFGFLDRPSFKHDDHALTQLPSPLPVPDNISPNYEGQLDRCFETGEHCHLNEQLTYHLRLDHYINRGSSQDPDFVENVAILQSEIHQRIKDKFSLVKLDTASLVSEPSDTFVDAHTQLLSYVPDDLLSALGIPASPSTTDSLKVDHLDSETQELFRRRVRHGITVKTYAVAEEVSQQLPSLTKLVKNPAYTWPFELDTFQKQAILCLERNQSVFVAAHTSAGKTVVAEYASAMCRRRGSRVIYTSPIKALSNQKFHDFRRTFGNDVGLLTGDIKLAADSSMLVMTTEILYNMLCSSAEAIRDLEVVIMDEVHYLNDAARGHVWEQIMIMLPKHVLLVMLSATVPNTMEFADWLGRIRGSEIHVVTTDKRPVPLEHYLFTGLDGQGGEMDLHLVVDQHGRFSLPGYKRALIAFNTPKKKKASTSETNTCDTSRAEELKALGRAPAGQRGGKSGSGSSGSKHSQQMTGGKFNTPGRWDYMPSPGTKSTHEKRTKNMWLGVVRLLQERNLMPAIAFGFSRNSLEMLAESLSSVDLLSKDEKNEVQHFLRFSIKNRLKGPDAMLPSVLFVSNLACRGLAVHHAGMLPLLKETVEILFQRGLIRLLFATETFAMGVNMPARCVLFTTLEKYDGVRRRPLNPGEYTQMAGRAGRRGLDASGTVIIMVEGVGHSVASIKSGLPSQETLTNMILGIPAQLSSQFRITYTMILHLHRTNWLSPQDIMRRSFMEAPALKREIARRQHLSRLRSILETTTTLIPSGGAAASSSRSWMGKTTLTATPSTVPVGEPVLQVKCPLGELSCCEAMAIYYQACCRLRHLAASVSPVLAGLPLSDLQRVLCPGRLVFVQLPAAARPTDVQKRLPNWLVPAIIVDLNKTSVHGVTEVQCNLITWQPPNRLKGDSFTQLRFIAPSSTNENTSAPDASSLYTVEDPDMDDEVEEEILLEGEDSWMSTTPFPPQLMPVFIPSSFDDALHRLTLIPDQNLQNLVRICDQVVQFKSFRPSINANVTLSDQLLKGIRRHRQEVAAAEAGLRLVVGTSTSSADSDLPQFMLEVNQGLLDLIQPFIGAGLTDSDAPPPVVYGLLPDCPPPLHLGRATRAKANTEDASVLFDELWMLSEELTAPLTGSHITTQRIAPVTCPDLMAHLALFHRTCRRRWAVKRLETSLSDDRLHLNAEYLGRLRVLEELGFIDSASERGCLTLKGLVACELQQMEVLLTQLLLDGSFTKLPPADIAALLSCFVFDLRASEHVRDDQTLQPVSRETPSHLVVLDSVAPPADAGAQTVLPTTLPVTPQELADLPEHLLEPVLKIYESAANLQQLQRKHRLSDPTTDTQLNCSLVRVTHAWATGHPFAALVQMTGTQEGNLVRGLLRLDELLRHVCNACHRLGDQALGIRMNEARMAVHRDLICAPSLYISEELAPSPSPV